MRVDLDRPRSRMAGARRAGARAEDVPPAPAVPSPIAAPTLHGNLALSLQEAIAMGLENNLERRGAAPRPADRGEDGADRLGRLRPRVLRRDPSTSTARRRTRSRSTRRARRRSKGVDGEGGLRGLVPWLGASYELSLSSSRLETNSTIQSVSPELRSVVSIGLNVPLLRGLIWNEPWTRVKTTRILHEAELENFRREVMDTVRDIEDAYWNLIANEEQLPRRGEEPRDGAGPARADPDPVRGRRRLEGRGHGGRGRRRRARVLPHHRGEPLPHRPGSR